MMTEIGVVICGGVPVYWHLPPGRNSAFLPDSRELWDVLWEHRHELDGFAHSHPGMGYPGPSSTDLSTFAAIESGLGKRLNWWITTPDRCILCNMLKPSESRKYNYETKYLDQEEEPSWLDDLRHLSYIEMNEIDWVIKMNELNTKIRDRSDLEKAVRDYSEKLSNEYKLVNVQKEEV
jgi:hypothetical protein